MAGVVGFEPTVHDTKNLMTSLYYFSCITYPNKISKLSFMSFISYQYISPQSHPGGNNFFYAIIFTLVRSILKIGFYFLRIIEK